MSKQSLLTSAKELFLKYGIKSVSMDDIARLLGISKKTIYSYVSNKSELVVESLKCFVKEEEDSVCSIVKNSKNAIEELTAIGEYVGNSLRKMKPTLMYDLQKYYGSTFKYIREEHFAHIENTIKTNIQRGISEGFYRDDLDPEIQAKLYVGLAQLLVDEENFPSSKYERVYLYNQILKYHLHGITNDKGRKELQKYTNNEN